VDHQDAVDLKQLRVLTVALAQEVDRGGLSRTERELFAPEA
jgi:hypothetical protein